MLTITILALICATSLYITSQNATSDMQTASWQQSLTAAESGVDAAIRALNNKNWTNWISVNQNATDLPMTEPVPSPSPSASAAPDSSHYNILPSSALTLKTPPAELVSGPKAAVSAPGGRVGASAEPTASAISKPAPTSSGGGFWIQIAAFKDANQAVRLATRMRREGYPADVRRRDSTANLWVVWVGKYPTRERAEAVRAALEKKGFRGFLL